MGQDEKERRERQLRALLLQAAALYRVTMEEIHIRAYAASLARFDLDVVREALVEAQTMYLDWFPTAPQLVQVAVRLERARRPKLSAPQASEPDHLRGRLPESNPYEQLARRWERRPPTKSEGQAWLRCHVGS